MGRRGPNNILSHPRRESIETSLATEIIDHPARRGVRLDDRQRIANFREQPIETNEYHSVDGAEGEFLWSSSPQNVDLLPQRPNLCLKHYPRPDQIDNHPTNEPAKIPHCARSSSDPRSTAKQDKVC